jgi:potassium efflux system protein
MSSPPGALFGSRTPSSVLAGLLLLICTSAAALAEEAAPAGQAAQPAETEPPPSPARDITVRSQAALANIDRIRAEVDELSDGAAEADQAAQLKERVDDLLPEGQTVDDLDPASIDGVLVRSRALTAQSNALIDNLTKEAEALEAHLSEVKEMTASWQAVSAEAVELPDALKERVGNILTATAGLETLINGKLNRVIELQNASMDVRNVITPIEERIDSYGRSQQTRLFEQNAAPIWSLSSEYISQSSERSTRRITGSLRRDFMTWVGTSEASIGGHVLLLPLLLALLYRLRGAMTEKPVGVLARPLPASVLIWMLLGIAVYVGAPATIRMVYVVVATLVAAVVLLQFLPKNMRAGVIVFIAIAIFERVIEGLPITEQAPRLAYLVLGMVMVVLAVLGLRRGTLAALVEWGAPRPFIHGGVYVAVVLIGVSIVANSVGYVHLAKLLLSGVLDSIAVFLVLFAGLTSMSEIIEAGLSLKALDSFRSIAHNRYRLKRVLRRPLVWLSLFLWAWATTRSFGIDQWLITTLRAMFLAEMSIGEVTLSLRGVVVFVLAVWLAVWTSRIVRAVLNQDVLPRMDLPRGVPNTIAMTAHYSIILIGLLLGVGFMGIDLSNLAFIVGALGVGIGFGLQNVVNNFVSGLILIFEAPIQVGDVVEVGTLMGRVVQIGIRTSRVRTFNGSEVIVPNGDLVSSQVINWTMSDRQRRLELRVGVAYGSDPEQVTELLREVATADEAVLDDPAPIILFSEFGDSSLNFRVLVWVGDFDVGFETIHRLNTAINKALAEAGITIPFPQRDLHLKTVPDRFVAGDQGGGAPASS